jgi:hypothetical protein
MLSLIKRCKLSLLDRVFSTGMEGMAFHKPEDGEADPL